MRNFISSSNPINLCTNLIWICPIVEVSRLYSIILQGLTRVGPGGHDGTLANLISWSNKYPYKPYMNMSFSRGCEIIRSDSSDNLRDRRRKKKKVCACARYEWRRKMSHWDSNFDGGRYGRMGEAKWRWGNIAVNRGKAANAGGRWGGKGGLLHKVWFFEGGLFTGGFFLGRLLFREAFFLGGLLVGWPCDRRVLRLGFL